jgi:Gpi18-like mannosyltransferase
MLKWTLNSTLIPLGDESLVVAGWLIRCVSSLYCAWKKERKYWVSLLSSNLSFLGSIFFLYRLGKEVLGDERAPRRASYLFCIAPSTVFMSSLYSERYIYAYIVYQTNAFITCIYLDSLMCLCSFSGMYFLELHKRQLLTSTKKKSSSSVKYLIISSILCGLASATRSNGILLSCKRKKVFGYDVFLFFTLWFE